MKKTLIALLLVFQLPCVALCAEKQKKISAKEYIETYKSLAVEAMQEYGIPASIKLAQALIESDNGNSPLALKANNHFGIKCKTTWSGDKMLHDDDEKDECFRSYRSAYDSYRDHSDFLADSPRYRFLFDLDPTDYKGWARGLSHAGYATNPDYANMLIKAIEQNGLYKIDKEITANTPSVGKNSTGKSSARNDNKTTAPATAPAAPVKQTAATDPAPTQTATPKEELPEGVLKVESRPGVAQRTVSAGPIVIPGPKVIGSTRSPQRSTRTTQTRNTVTTPAATPSAPVKVPAPVVAPEKRSGNHKNEKKNDDLYAYNPEDFEPAKPAEETPRPRKHIDMPPAPEAARPSGTSEIVYGAPVNSPAGFYDGPKFDPAGMPASGSKGGILVYRNNNIPCTIAAPGQTIQSIASALKIKPATLLAYNELNGEPAGITPGSIVYIAPKSNSVRNGYKTHYVVKGETLHYVAQKYGIYVAKLAKVNGMDLNYQIKPGQKLRLQ